MCRKDLTSREKDHSPSFDTSAVPILRLLGYLDHIRRNSSRDLKSSKSFERFNTPDTWEVFATRLESYEACLQKAKCWT
jgi:hypothetical protein